LLYLNLKQALLIITSINKMAQKPYFSIISPLFNEEKNIKSLHQEIVMVMKSLKKPYEIIFVDDGSSDHTLQVLKKLKPVKIIKFRKNFGQSAALDAGIKNSQGEILITLDGDGQNDPKDIPKLVKQLNENYDVVCGWRYRRNDPLGKKVISKFANYIGSFLVSSGIHDSGCTLRVYRRECFEDLDLYGEMHRMIPALIRWRGFKITEVKVNHKKRKFGKTKYTLTRTVKGFLDMFEVWFWRKYENRPLHLFGSLGFLLSFLSFAFGIYLVIMRLFFNYSLSNRIWPLVAITGFITGIQFLIFGLLADLIIKNRSRKDFYRIKEIIEK
jgi:glycosyltransferase involved in cell wall biosynthesis